MFSCGDYDKLYVILTKILLSFIAISIIVIITVIILLLLLTGIRKYT